MLCGRWDLNPHVLQHRNLNPACLPISSRPRVYSFAYPFSTPSQMLRIFDADSQSPFGAWPQRHFNGEFACKQAILIQLPSCYRSAPHLKCSAFFDADSQSPFGAWPQRHFNGEFACKQAILIQLPSCYRSAPHLKCSAFFDADSQSPFGAWPQRHFNGEFACKQAILH